MLLTHFFLVTEKNKTSIIEVLCIKKVFNVDLQFSKHKETTLPNEFIFVFIFDFIGAILSEKSSQKRGIWEKL